MVFQLRKGFLERHPDDGIDPDQLPGLSVDLHQEVLGQGPWTLGGEGSNPSECNHLDGLTQDRGLEFLSYRQLMDRSLETFSKGNDQSHAPVPVPLQPRWVNEGPWSPRISDLVNELQESNRRLGVLYAQVDLPDGQPCRLPSGGFQGTKAAAVRLGNSMPWVEFPKSRINVQPPQQSGEHDSGHPVIPIRVHAHLLRLGVFDEATDILSQQKAGLGFFDSGLDHRGTDIRGSLHHLVFLVLAGGGPTPEAPEGQPLLGSRAGVVEPCTLFRRDPTFGFEGVTGIASARAPAGRLIEHEFLQGV